MEEATNSERVVLQIYKNICFQCQAFTGNVKHEIKACIDDPRCTSKKYEVVIGVDVHSLQMDYVNAILEGDEEAISSIFEILSRQPNFPKLLSDCSLMMFAHKEEDRKEDVGNN